MTDTPRETAKSCASRIAALAVLGAAAWIAFAGSACANDLAKTGTTNISLDGYCDELTLTVFAWHQAGMSRNDCQGNFLGVGAGMEGDVTGVSHKDLTISEAFNYYTDRIYLWNIQYPLKTGRTWSLYLSLDGANFSYVRSGTYTVTDDTNAPRHEGGISLRESIETSSAPLSAPPIGATSTSGAIKIGGNGTTYINLDGWCDVLKITVFAWHQAGEYTPTCNGEAYTIGAGMEGKVTGVLPKDLTLGDVYAGFDSPIEIFLYNIQYPLATGHTWSVYGTTDGVNFKYIDSGTYSVTNETAARSVRSGPSIHDKPR